MLHGGILERTTIAMTKRKTKRPHVYFVNDFRPRLYSDYELKESSLSFDAREFAKDVKEQMKDLEVTPLDLSKVTYITEDRIRNIIYFRGGEVTREEVKTLKKVLHLT
jgi:hypothetical protein